MRTFRRSLNEGVVVAVVAGVVVVVACKCSVVVCADISMLSDCGELGGAEVDESDSDEEDEDDDDDADACELLSSVSLRRDPLDANVVVVCVDSSKSSS